MDLILVNKTALVTGSTAGIGFAIAKSLAAEGARVIVNGRTGVTKTMQVALARGLAETTAGTGVTVNSILAGPTRSEGVEKFIGDLARSKNVAPEQVAKDFFHTARPSSLLQRFATPDEVAALVTFVASPVSAATNGAALRVEGGLVRSIL